MAERDNGQAQLSEVESRIRQLEDAFTVAQEQFRRQRETTVQTIRQIAAERDESRARLSEAEDRMRKLEEESAANQGRLSPRPDSAATDSTAMDENSPANQSST